MEIDPLSVVSFAIIFSHSEACLFHHAYGFLHCLKLLSSISSQLFTLGFISITLGGGSLEDLAVIYITECSAYVSL